MRDLILNKIPKDFDVITSAELKEVSFILYSPLFNNGVKI